MVTSDELHLSPLASSVEAVPPLSHTHPQLSRSAADVYGVLGFGIEPLFQKATHESYIQFLCPGVVATALVSTCIVSGLGLVGDRQFGFLKQTLVAPAPSQVAIGDRSLEKPPSTRLGNG
jgi:ABC-type multidrug transport system permease subunit